MRTSWFAAALCVSAAGVAQAPLAPSPLIIDRSRVDRAPPIAPPTATRPRVAVQPKVEAQDDAAGVTIKGIRFEGVQVPAPVARAAERFVGRPASKANLEALAAAMSQAYADTQVALYTVLVPRQDAADGTVRVIVAEGFVEGVQISGDVEGRKLALVRAYADRLIREKPLTRATMERYLSLIRDVPGLTLDAQLLQGINPGGVQLALKVRQKRTEFSAGIDNRASDLLGDWQATASAKGYGLLREGDYTEVTGATSLDRGDYVYGSLTHSTPIGTDGTRLAASGGYLRTRPDDVPVRGEAVIAGLTLSHPLLRSYQRNLTVSAAVDLVNSDNALVGSLIAQEHSRAARVALAYGETKGKHAASLSVTISQGLDLLGARVIAPIAETGFTKVNARASFDRALGRKAAIRLRAGGQYSRDRLPAVERFAAGGAEYGRAFDTALLTGDRGYGASAELAWRPIAGKLLANSELYGFVDGARVGIRPRAPFAGGSFDLASAGAGVRLAVLDKGALEVEAARAIDRPYPGYEGDWRLSVGWRLSLR